MPRMRTSRRVSGLKETDYDHEINLVDGDDAANGLVTSDSKQSMGNAASSNDGELSSRATKQNPLPSTSGPSSQTSLSRRGRPPAKGGAGEHALEPDSGDGEGRGPSIEIQGERIDKSFVFVTTASNGLPPPDATPSAVRTTTTRNTLSKPPTRDREAIVDILYENERGGFLCGVALFSSKALGNLDPSPWTNAFHKTSPTDIHSTQLPDPTWEWAWPEWRIYHHDDVDEGGWEYSFMFSNKFSWHGPRWWNSFVRRRAWIRKRVKKDPQLLTTTTTDPHFLNTDYFTVKSPSDRSGSHSRSRSRGSSVGGGSRASFASQRSEAESVFDIKNDPIEDVDTLLHVLRKARIDREKLEAVGNYLEHCGSDLENLGPEMHEVMVVFVFQASRKLLLSRLTQALDKAIEDADKEDTPSLRERKANLEVAVKHADEEVRKLAYWSDIKGMVESGKSAHGAHESKGWGEEWEGVDQSGPAGPQKRDTETDMEIAP
ncbi:hypothetical protein jhhlp_006143 [Lomentospora prolificans]|uniref:Peroxin/Ferlin domain-containing protein n=1 Tax=Lomentospora prolificans TaxID=41688 RepID=A0A2N3N531_9PEZI|nr:hypothetical protein jhhlp_006143 [Lomentospora prolificans]